jgi:hypothetical protein
MLLSMAERRLGVAERLARCIPDRRDPSRIAHTIADMIRARVFAICCGYEEHVKKDFKYLPYPSLIGATLNRSKSLRNDTSSSSRLAAQ